MAREAEGRKGKAGDGKAHTREVKLGCLFTQTKLNEEGRALPRPALLELPGHLRARRAIPPAPAGRGMPRAAPAPPACAEPGDLRYRIHRLQRPWAPDARPALMLRLAGMLVTFALAWAACQALYVSSEWSP